jgi:hypothetical protein
MILTKKVDIIKRIEEIKSELNFLESINTGCQKCINFDRGGCRMASGHTPPQDILETGCNEWVWDEVPF